MLHKGACCVCGRFRQLSSQRAQLLPTRQEQEPERRQQANPASSSCSCWPNAEIHLRQCHVPKLEPTCEVHSTTNGLHLEKGEELGKGEWRWRTLLAESNVENQSSKGPGSTGPHFCWKQHCGLIRRRLSGTLQGTSAAPPISSPRASRHLRGGAFLVSETPALQPGFPRYHCDSNSDQAVLLVI